MPSLYFKHIIYKIFGETGLKNVNSRDSSRYFWQLDSHILILHTRTSVTGNLKNIIMNKDKNKDKKKRMHSLFGGSGLPFWYQDYGLSYKVIGKHG